MNKLEDHKVFAFLPFSLVKDKIPDESLSALCIDPEMSSEKHADDGLRQTPKPAASVLPQKLEPAALGRYRIERIFRPDGEKKGDDGNNRAKGKTDKHGEDLYLPAHKIVSNQDNRNCKIYVLSDRMKSLLSSGDIYEKTVPDEEKTKHQLVLLLKPSSEKRLRCVLPAADEVLKSFKNADGLDKGNALAIPISISDIILYHFETEQAIARVSIKVLMPKNADFPSDLLVEITDHIGRFATLGWIEQPNIHNPTKALTHVFTLGDMVSRMVNGPIGRPQKNYRSYTHTYAQFDANGPEVTPDITKKLAGTLARQYNSDYDLDLDNPSVFTVAEFHNVMHACCREGSASVVDPRKDGKRLTFLSNYLESSIERKYTPILMLNLHQLYYMLSMNAFARRFYKDEALEKISSSSTTIETGLEEELSNEWRQLEQELADFKANFRFVQISQISMHNAFNNTLRTCFDLDKLEQTLTSDLASMSASIQAAVSLSQNKRRKHRERLFKRISKLVTAGVTGVFLLEFFQTLQSLLDIKAQYFPEVALLISVFSPVAVFWYLKIRENTDE